MAQTWRDKKWWLALAVASLVTFLAVLPSLQVWSARGGAWADADASFSSDEVAYCAYVNALIDGRPRRSDPYTGNDDVPHESLFSIQFLPPYAVALLARVLGLTAPQVFLLLNFLIPFATALALFTVLYGVLRDPLWAAAGVLVIICFGSFAVYFGPVRVLRGVDTTYTFAHLPFMRRYVPAVPFPLLWAWLAWVGHAFTSENIRKGLVYAMLAGVAGAALVFSYFYLWTAALAWFGIFAAWWWIARPADRARIKYPLLLILLILGGALAVYGGLVLQRAPSMDTVQLLALSHKPDVGRDSVRVGLLVLACLGLSVWRGWLNWREPAFIGAISCSLAPFLMFNQQILTGRSLQPLHYELYIAKYFALAGAWITLGLVAQVWRVRRPANGAQMWQRLGLILLAGIALGWGVFETTLDTRRYLQQNPTASGVQYVARRVHERARSEAINGIVTVFYNNLGDAEYAPTYAPEAVLWAPHLPAFAATAAESKERIYQSLYYTGVTLDGVDENNYNQTEPRTRHLLHSLIEWAYNEPAWTVNWQPLQPAVIRAEIAAYRAYTQSFSQTQAARVPLSYVVVNDYTPVTLDNLDRWYERDAGERLSSFTIYRVRLKQP